MLNNNTLYTLVNYPSGTIGVYLKEYIDSLGDDDPIEVEQMIALIDWSICDKNAETGLAKILLYEEAEFELIALFALSTFIIFKKKHDAAINSLVGATAIINTMNMQRKH